MDGLLGSDFFLTFIVKINFPLGSIKSKAEERNNFIENIKST